MSQPVPYQAPVLQPNSQLISQPWYLFFASLSNGGGAGGGSTEVSWIPETGPITPHGQETAFTGSISRSLGAKAGERISVADFGAVGDGGTDDAPAFNRAIAAAINKPGCDIYVPGGYKYLLNSRVTFNGGAVPLTMSGDGASSVILCGAQIPNGQGFLDISGSDVTIRNLLIDGQKTTPDRLQYDKDFQGVGGNDPLAGSLTTGTSVWIHAGAARITLDGVIVQHTRGYAVLINATEGADITDVDIRNCWFLNNRPALFGIASNDLNYGAWNGGIMFHGDGRAGAPFMVRGLSVDNCHWRRCAGNSVWSHLYGFSSLHENIRISNNDFLDNGLDCIQFAGVCGGVASGNYARRVGYICSDDGTEPGTPKWLNGAWASFLDTSGQVIGVDYTGNTGISINGDGINLDGYSNGTVVGNTLRQPLANEPEYITDQIGAVGFAGSSIAGGPNYAHGMLSSNTSNDLPGGDSICVVGNAILNFSDGAILLYAGRRCVVQSNNIEHPANATESPIVLGNVGTGANQRTYDSAVYGNRIGWLPASPRPCIREDASLAPFSPGDSNHVGVNTIIPVSGLAYGFQSATTSSSRTEVRFDSNQPGLTFPSYYYMQSEGAADTSVLRWYYAENENTPAIAMQLQSRYGQGLIGPLFNVASNGSAGSGVISTGSKVNSAVPDAVLTGHAYCDGFMVLTNATYSDTDANKFNTNQWALIRYNPSLGYLEQSVAVSGGSRVWSQLGADQAAGPINAVQYNGGNALAGNGNFAFDPVNVILYVTGYNGSGVIAHEFNSTASGGDHAVNTGGGAGFITGSGLAAFQSLVATSIYAGSANQDGSINTINGDCYANRFNSPATGTTQALTVNNGAAIIFGSGNVQCQTLTANSSVAANFTSTSTGNNVGYSNNGGAGAFAAIYANGQLACQWIALGNQSSAPTPQSGVAFLYASSSGLFASINGGAYSPIGGGANIESNGVPIGSVTTLNFSTNLSVTISSGVATITASGSGSGISGVKTSDGAAYSNSGGYAILSFINSAGLINTSAVSVSGTCNAGNFQISGTNGDTVNVSYTGLDGQTHTLSFLRGILIGHS